MTQPKKTTARLTGRQILDLEMLRNDADAKTVRGYLTALLLTVWFEGEGFSGKRPFGNSGWKHELYKPLISGGAVQGTLDEYGHVDKCDRAAADEAIRSAIDALSANRLPTENADEPDTCMDCGAEIIGHHACQGRPGENADGDDE